MSPAPRRRFVLATGALMAAQMARFARAQRRIPRVGVLVLGGAGNFKFILEPFRQGMAGLGYVEERDYTLELRSADGRPERLQELAADLVQAKVDVILATAALPAQAAKQATASIPIVLGSHPDPVGAGLVSSLARPGGNVTGISNIGAELGPKQMELLLEVVPKLRRLGFLFNPANNAHGPMRRALQTAAKSRGIVTLPVEARTPEEIETAFAALARSRPDALLVALDPNLVTQRRRIAELALKARWPAIYAAKEHAEAGGLISYGQNLAQNYRRAAAYVDRILKGARPGELAVEQPTTLELVLNRTTARAIGIQFPPSLLLRAAAVID